MLLTITLTQAPATDLGYLLHKSPGRVHTRPLAFGPSHVFYPEASAECCTAALLLDVDPVGLVRGRRPGPSLEPYVNDRPYVASSFLSVAIADQFGTAMNGRSRERQDLADQALPFEVGIPVLPSRGGDLLVRKLFEPLGYAVESTGYPLDPTFPEWGEAPFRTVRLSATVRLRDLLSHLYVLIPVLDDQKHYWVSAPEIEKLLRRGEGWLPNHPERELIASRYLARQASLAREALRRLVADDAEDLEASDVEQDAEEAVVEEPISLHDQRIGAVMAALRASGASRVLDLGCGEGRLLSELAKDHSFSEIVGVDVSARSLEIAARRLKIERMNERQRDRLRLLQGALTYRDDRLAGFDAAVLMEVIEHVEPGRLSALERAVFEFAHSTHVIVTTPNAEYLFPSRARACALVRERAIADGHPSLPRGRRVAPLLRLPPDPPRDRDPAGQQRDAARGGLALPRPQLDDADPPLRAADPGCPGAPRGRRARAGRRRITVDRIDNGSLEPWLAALAARGPLPYQALAADEQAWRGRYFLMVVNMGASAAFAWANALSPMGPTPS